VRALHDLPPTHTSVSSSSTIADLRSGEAGVRCILLLGRQLAATSRDQCNSNFKLPTKQPKIMHELESKRCTCGVNMNEKTHH
jgi:hypothetical protein